MGEQAELVRTWLASSPDLLGGPTPDDSATTCIGVAHLLMDPDHAAYVLSGRHPLSGVEGAGSPGGRLQAHLRQGPHRPWDTARRLSMFCRASHVPTRYVWHAVVPHGRALSIAAGRLGEHRPVILLDLTGRSGLLVLDAVADELVVLDPVAAKVRALMDEDRPRWVVMPTGRRASE